MARKKKRAGSAKRKSIFLWLVLVVVLVAAGFAALAAGNRKCLPPAVSKNLSGICRAVTAGNTRWTGILCIGGKGGKQF